MPTNAAFRLPPFPARFLAAALAAAFACGAQALPTGANVTLGQAGFAQQGSQLTVTNSNGAAIQWQSFSIGAGETVRFLQPSAASSVLNRVTGPDPSQLLGNLSSNGRVFLVNPAGILVGPGARIDVAAFVASTLNLRNEDFLANRLNFEAGSAAGTVRNEGLITTPQGGQVYLVGSKVINAGGIVAPGGDVALAAGRSVQIGDTASPGVRVQVSGDETASNLGRVVAEAGRIGIVGALVKSSGTLNASGVVSEGGRIYLKATRDAIVEGDAVIAATGSRGGRVEVTGERVALTDRAAIDVSGANGGGVALVGGDTRGANPEVQNASVTWVGPQASIRADATQSGDGGRVAVWADDTARAYGSISARGAGTGAGGHIETSGKRYLDVNGIRIDAGAASGRSGEWLLDPDQITVVSGSSGLDSNVTSVTPFQAVSSAATSTLSSATLNSAINAGGLVIISTSGGPGPGNGDITFDASGGAIVIDKTSNVASSTLRLDAWRNINFTGGPTTFRTSAGAGTQPLTVILNTDLSGGGGNVFSGPAATVNLNGTSTSQVVAVVGNGKTWFNAGSLNLDTNAALKLFDGLTVSTFQNSGTFTTSNITNNWFILSNPSTQAGVFNNAGTMNLGTGGGSIEAVLNNLSGGTLNVTAPVDISVQNGQNMSGTINMVSGARVIMSENHGTPATFAGTRIGGSGTLVVSGQTVTLDGVSAGGTALLLSGGNTTASGATTVFSSLSKAAPLTISGTNFGLSGDFVVPSGITYSGNVGLFSGGNLSLTATPVSSASVGLAAAGNLTVTNGNVTATNDVSMIAGAGIFLSTSGNVSAGGNVNLASGGNIVVTSSNVTASGNLNIFTGGSLIGNGTNLVASSGGVKAVINGDLVLLPGGRGSAFLDGATTVDLEMRSANSLILLGAATGSGSAKINPLAGPIRINFVSRADGGIFVDGAPTLGPGVNGSGFFIGSPPLAAMPGASLLLRYGAVANPCAVLPGLCVIKPPILQPAGDQAAKKPEPRDPDEGIGNFGGPPNDPKRKRPGVCKAA